jgi:hypothetical protein
MQRILIDKMNKENSLKDQLYQSLILKNQSRLPFFSNGFSNHFSMSLWSIRNLEAPLDVIKFQGSRERWLNYFKVYKLEFLPIPPSKGRINNENYLSHFGKPEYFSDYLDFFKKEDIINNTSKLIQLYNQLAGYIDAALFHPFIRFSIGLQDNNANEQIISLAYWITAISADKKIQISYNSSPEDLKIEKILAHFANTADFISLHYLTSYVAYLNLPPYLKEITKDTYRSVTDKYLNQINSKEEIQDEEGLDGSIREKAKQAAYISSNDHLIKIVYALLQLNDLKKLKGIKRALEKAIISNF